MLDWYPNGENSSQDIRDVKLLYALYLKDHAINWTLGISFSKKTGRISIFPDGNWTSNSLSRHPLCRLSCCISQSQAFWTPPPAHGQIPFASHHCHSSVVVVRLRQACGFVVCQVFPGHFYLRIYILKFCTVNIATSDSVITSCKGLSILCRFKRVLL